MKTVPSVLLTLLLVAGCASSREDPQCRIDTDGDGVVNCKDDDDDADGLSDKDEVALGTDPTSADSDADGLDDGVEVMATWTYTPGGLTGTDITTSDPTQPTLLVEIDYMTGMRPDPATVSAVEDAFGALGVEAFILVDDSSPITVVSPLSSAAEMESVLRGSDSQDEYVHAVFGVHAGGTEHGTAHTVSANDPALGHGNEPDPAAAGIFIFAQQISDDYAAFQSDFNSAGISEAALMARTLIHELGHALGCTHEGSRGGFDADNVMISNSDIGDPATDADRWQRATLGPGLEGYPSFTAAALDQMDLSRKLSVETATSLLDLDFDMGTATSPVNPDTYRVTPDSGFEKNTGYGWIEPLPTQAAEDGSDPADARTADYVSGDPDVIADTVFRVVGLGTGQAHVFLRLGATLATPRQVRCEITHPDRGTAWLQGTVDAGGDWVQTDLPGVLVHGIAQETSLGARYGYLDIRCLDGGDWTDAPWEYVRIEKLEP